MMHVFHQPAIIITLVHVVIHIRRDLQCIYINIRHRVAALHKPPYPAFFGRKRRGNLFRCAPLAALMGCLLNTKIVIIGDLNASSQVYAALF